MGKGKAVRANREKRWTWKKPEGRPNRSLSAYNIFFQAERQRILDERSRQVAANSKKNDGLTRFAHLGKTVAANWHKIRDDPQLTAPYKALAKQDKERYAKELKEWNEQQKMAAALAAAADEDTSIARGGATMGLPTTSRHGATSPLQVTDDDATHVADEEDTIFMDDASWKTFDVLEAPAMEATTGMAALNLNTVVRTARNGGIRQIGPHVVSPIMTNDTVTAQSAARATKKSFTSRMLRGEDLQVDDLWGPIDESLDLLGYDPLPLDMVDNIEDDDVIAGIGIIVRHDDMH